MEFLIMMHKFSLLYLLAFVTAACCAPAPDAATLLQNGEEAQALNRYFQGLKASDPCQDGQVACIAGKTIATCQGTAWSTTVDQCSKSQGCFALPSVRSPGTQLACTSEKSAENLISASGATGGIFGNPNNTTMEVYRGDTMKSGYEPLPTQVIQTNTPAYTPATATGSPGPTPDSSPVNNAGGDSVGSTSSHRQPCTKAGAVPSQSTPTAVPNAAPPYSAPPVLGNGAPSKPAPTKAAPKKVTVTVTLNNPSQPATLAPQTRTISPEDATSIIASIKAAARSTVAPNMPTYNAPAPALTSAAAADAQTSSTSITVEASPSPSPTVQGSYGGY
ncbi:hypothetical protein D9756_008332 [Leucocoprinus leucothites]|uniref:Uncharacterized protein n=1 Tax=Leucocoprinus leucothites TaxID=201217 RepID=A0A8H5FVT4_9AGAR|nr:hypothetical protein D9756_008332 [Leucoagaricus leucothites]